MTTARKDGYGPNQLVEYSGLGYGPFQRARELGRLPVPEQNGRWSQAQADDLKVRAQEIVDNLPPYLVGASKIAQQLQELHGLDVDGRDVETLSEAGLLPVVDHFHKRGKNWPLYDRAAADAIDREVLEGVIAERVDWEANSLTRDQVLTRLRLSGPELNLVCVERGIRPGRYQRFALADVNRMVDDEVTDQVRADRTVTSSQAAGLLEIRTTCFKHMVDAGWVEPVGTKAITVRRNGRRQEIDIPLYRIGDVEAIRENPQLRHEHWERLWDVSAGSASPLLETHRHAIEMGRAVRGFAARLTAEFGLRFQARHRHADNTWWLHWDYDNPDAPSAWEVGHRAHTDPHMEPYTDHLATAPDTEEPRS